MSPLMALVTLCVLLGTLAFFTNNLLLYYDDSDETLYASFRHWGW